MLRLTHRVLALSNLCAHKTLVLNIPKGQHAPTRNPLLHKSRVLLCAEPSITEQLPVEEQEVLDLEGKRQLFKALRKQGDIVGARRVMMQMAGEGDALSSTTFLHLLTLAAAQKESDMIEQLLLDMNHLQIDFDPKIIGVLLDYYGTAREREQLKLIWRYTMDNDLLDAIPVAIITSTIMYFGKLEMWEELEEILHSPYLEWDDHIVSALCAAYMHKTDGMVESIDRILWKATEKRIMLSTISYNSLLSAYLRGKEYDRVESLIHQDWPVDNRSVTLMLKYCADIKAPKSEIERVIKKLSLSKIKADATLLNTLVYVYSKANHLSRLRQLWHNLKATNQTNSLTPQSYTLLVRQFQRGYMPGVDDILRTVESPDMRLTNAIIEAYCRAKVAVKTMKAVVRELFVVKGVSPNNYTEQLLKKYFEGKGEHETVEALKNLRKPEEERWEQDAHGEAPTDH